MLNRTTINARIKRGMTREEAENTPLLIDKKLTLQKVLEVEAHGLSLSDSAYLLRVTPQRLGRFVKSHGIEWRGKKHCYKYGVDPDSQRQAILASGLPESTVYARMYRKNLTIEEVSLFSILGQKISHWKIKTSENSIKLPVKQVETGVYIVKIKTTDNNYFSEKIIIE